MAGTLAAVSLAGGYRPRGKSKNYTPNRTPKARWQKTPEGRCALLLIQLLAIEMVGSFERMVHGRIFPNKDIISNRVLGFLPWLPEWYMEETGLPLKPSNIYDRCHKSAWQYIGGEGVAKPSTESFLDSKCPLSKYASAVQALRLREKIVTRKEARRVCA